MPVIALLFLLGLAVLVSGRADAASVEVVEQEYCKVRVDGPIEKGDLEKILGAVEQAKKRIESKAQSKGLEWNIDYIDWINVCLNSEGGDFSEGLRIIDHLNTNADFGTVVDKGDACYSVCAFVFMAGRYFFYHDLTQPIRLLHVGGTLGFNTPPFKVGEGTQDMEQVATAYEGGVRAISDLLATSQNEAFFDHDRMLPRSLMLEVLSKEPDEALKVSNIEQAGKWEIQVIGFEPPEKLTDEMLLCACKNVASLEKRQRGASKSWTSSGEPIVLKDQKYRKEFGGLEAGEGASCVVDVYDAGARGWFISANVNLPHGNPYVPEPGFLEEQVTRGSDESRVGLPPGTPLWMIYPPDTLLSDLTGN